MDHLWSVLCRQVITSKETNNVTLIDVLETVRFSMTQKGLAAQVGAIPFSASVVSLWWRSKLEVGENAHIRVLIKDPDGNQLLPEENVEVYADLENAVSFRTTINFETLPFSKDGMYRAIVQVKSNTRWKEVASLPYFIYEIEDLDEFRKQRRE